MTALIHPSAYIAPTAELGSNVHVGPFAVIEDGARIGDGSRIGAHAVICGHVRMGKDNVVHPHVVLGDVPQDTHFQPSTETWLQIGDGNVFREGFTAHRATVAEGATRIGNCCYFMNNSHVAHDCTVGDQVIFANNVAIGGFVQVDRNVFMGGAVVVHQFCRVGAYAIVQGTTGINMDVLPFTLIAGYPAKHYRLNLVGLRRAGIVGDDLKVLSTAFRRLRAKQELDDLQMTEQMQYLRAWLAANSKRGMHGFVEAARETGL
jgi:UDP-N-acetylglucosamine acyltransferase